MHVNELRSLRRAANRLRKVMDIVGEYPSPVVESANAVNHYVRENAAAQLVKQWSECRQVPTSDKYVIADMVREMAELEKLI